MSCREAKKEQDRRRRGRFQRGTGGGGGVKVEGEEGRKGASWLIWQSKTGQPTKEPTWRECPNGKSIIT